MLLDNGQRIVDITWTGDGLQKATSSVIQLNTLKGRSNWIQKTTDKDVNDQRPYVIDGEKSPIYTGTVRNM